MGQMPLTEPTAVAGHAPTSDGEQASVLIVESGPTGAELLDDALATTGDGDVRVVHVTRLADAIEYLAQRDVEVVLVDLHLPGCNDTDPCTRIREAAPEALVLPLGDPGAGQGTAEAAPGGADDAPAWRHSPAGWLPDVLRYVTRRKRAEAVLHAVDEALFEEQERARVTLDSIGDAVLVTDIRGNVTYLNPVAEHLTGRTCAEAAGLPLSEVFEVIDETTREPAMAPALRAMQEDRTVGLAANCVLLRHDGGESGIEDSAAPIHDRHGRVTGAVIVFRDVSQSRAMTRKMAYLAEHDALTGLPNRALLNERLSQAIGLARRHEKQVALLFMDLDQFKQINDSLGHLVGDHVLQAVAERLTDNVRTTDTVCRQGGDEFVVLLAELTKPEDAIHVAENLLAAFAEPLVVDGHTLHVTISIGISVFPDDGDTAESIIEHADAAMYSARANDNDDRYLSQADRNDRATARGNAEISLHRAFKQGEFLLHYQPRIDLATSRIDGVEAFIRWQDPDRGLIPPDDFLPLAERCGLIVPIGHWVLQEACRQANAWQAAGLPALPVAVNVSATEFSHEHFVDGVADILRNSGIDPGRIELEVTETVLMQDVDASIATLNALRGMGLRVTIDNFGSGHSSLGHLGRFPVDILKLDKAFMANIGVVPESTTVLRTIISLGRSLGHRVVAGGVENLQQLSILHVERCDGAQGIEVSQPVTADEFSRLLADARAQAGRLPLAQPETA